jgi:sulfoxide reductase heme-binding subunit YedZ
MQISKIGVAKVAIFLICLLPFWSLVWRALNAELGANPVETITHTTGDWSLYFLFITLAISPIRDITGKSSIFRFRRMLGLFVFFYAILHFSTWLVFDHAFNWAEIQKDIYKRPYITVGFSAFCLLIPLALTSTNRMRQRLGKRWNKLHQFIYVIATLSVLHYLWLVKADTREPVVWACILLLLLFHRLRKKHLVRTKKQS